MSQLISVIVPCYNQAQYLDECLQSVLDQTYHNWECIIVNDGSPDNTEDLAKKWVEKDGRFKYFYKENGGLSSARNFGIEKAEGEWILPLDADDFISDDYLELAKDYFDNDLLKVIYCNAEKFGNVKEKLKLKKFNLKNLAQNNMIFCTAFFRKMDWLKVGGYDENLKIGLEDWEFWIRMLKDDGEVLKLQNTCFFYRIKNNSMIVDLIQRDNSIALKYLEKKHIDFFHYHLGSLVKNYASNKEFKAINNRKLNRIINQFYFFVGKMLKFL